MKYLIMFAALMVALWLWRQGRNLGSNNNETQADEPSKCSNRPESIAPPTEIVACDFCSVHLPRSEAVAASGKLYCSAAHKRQAGD